MEMKEQIQMACGTHKNIAANKCKISIESLTDNFFSKGAQTHSEAIEPKNQTPGVIARLMGLDKLPTEFTGSRNSSTELKADRISVHSTTSKSILERQHHEYENVSFHQHSNSEDEKVKLHFRNNPQEQQLQEFGMSQIQRKEGHSRSYSKLQEPEFSESEELLDAVKFLQSNKETFMRFLQGSNTTSVDKDMEKYVASFCFPSHKIEDVKEWNAYEALHFIKPQKTNRSHKKNRSGFGRNAVGTSRVPTFDGIESSERWHYHGEYLMDSEKNQHNNVDFNIFSRGEYLMDHEKNLSNTHNNIPSRIVVLKPNTSRVLNSKSVLVEFPDDFKKVREGDKNIDQDFNGVLLNNGTKDLYKSDSTVAADIGDYKNSLKSPRQIGKDTAKHGRKSFFRDFMATYKHMYPTADPDLLGVVSKFKKGSDDKMDKPTINCSDPDFKEGKPKKEFRITILRPTGLVQKTPNSGWGEATKKSERTLFEMKKPVTNQATSQFNNDVDSIGVDIPNPDSCVKSQKHVYVSKNQASFESSLISANDILKKSANSCHEKEQSEHSPFSVLDEPFVEEEYIEFNGKCLDPQCDLPSQPHQEEEEEAFQGSAFENFMDYPGFDDAYPIDVKHLDHMKNSEMLYVEDVITASGLMRDGDILRRIHSLSQPLDPSLFQMVDMRYLSQQSGLGTLKSPSQRQLLFDSLNEILCDLLGFPVHCCHRMLTSQCMLPSRESLVNHVLSAVVCPFETVENLVAKHVIRAKWLEPNMGIEALGDRMERHILDDLIEETTILLFPSK